MVKGAGLFQRKKFTDILPLYSPALICTDLSHKIPIKKKKFVDVKKGILQGAEYIF